jgi:hypothetical protein
MGEFAGDLAGPFIPAGHVVDHDDAGMWSGIGRVGVIRIAAIAAVPAISRHPRLYVPKSHVDPPSKMPAALLAPNPRKSKPDIQQHGRSRLDIARALSRLCSIG